MKSRLFLGIFAIFALIGSAAFGAFSENSRQGSDPIFSISGQGVEVLNPGTDPGFEGTGSENRARLNTYAKVLTSFYSRVTGGKTSLVSIGTGTDFIIRDTGDLHRLILSRSEAATTSAISRTRIRSGGSPRMAKENDWSLLSAGGEALRPNFCEIMFASSDQVLFASLKIRRNFYRN